MLVYRKYLEYKYAKKKILPLSFVFLVPGLYLFYLSLVEPVEFVFFLRLFLLIVFIFLPLNLLVLSLTRPYHLRISKAEIIDNTSLISYGNIPWRYVKNIQFEGSGYFRDVQSYLKVSLTNPDKYFLEKRGSVIKTMLLKLRYRADKKTMIPISLLNKSSRDIEEEIRQFLLKKSILLGAS